MSKTQLSGLEIIRLSERCKILKKVSDEDLKKYRATNSKFSLSATLLCCSFPSGIEYREDSNKSFDNFVIDKKKDSFSIYRVDEDGETLVLDEHNFLLRKLNHMLPPSTSVEEAWVEDKEKDRQL
jgi:hypothetical protein